MKCILQTEQSECGLACLAMIANYFGYRTELADLRRLFSISLKGLTLGQLMQHAALLQLSSRPVRLELEEIAELRLPCILHWDLKHFVVLKEVRKSLRGGLTFLIFDPAVGERRLALPEVSRHFTGVALELTPTPLFVKKETRERVSLRQLIGKTVGLKSSVVKALCMAFILELFALVSPLFNQFVLDEVIVGGDEELLKVLIVGLALILVTQTAIGAARSWYLTRWGLEVGFQWSARLIYHTLRLPATFFEKRHLGDVMSRLGSIDTIKNTLTTLFVESALDGLMAALALGMMYTYSAVLSTVVLVSVALYVLLRAVFYGPLREASRERLVLGAKENSNLLETIRAIVPLKLFGREVERHSRWQNLKQDVFNRDAATQKLAILFKTSNSTITSFQALLLLYVGARLVIENAISVGMLVAFGSYAATFSSRIFSLVDVFVSVRMLAIHTERLADIVLEEPEPELALNVDTSGIEARLSLKNVSFRYADGEPFVLSNVELEIKAGESLAIVGNSGCGKTTLCKIVLGLFAPTNGEVLVGGIPVRQLGLRNYRRLIGTVMQDDVLLAGSILDNISFFDSAPDLSLAEHCARLSAIHDEIVKMPMGYQSLVGDMGSSLSGGQKQRILLARALYKQPKILVLDEATSHLDLNNEHRVSSALKEMRITRIIVAHRPETIRSAERVVTIRRGSIMESNESRRSGCDDKAERSTATAL